MDYFEVRGVPSAMRQDGWWLSGEGDVTQKRVRIGEGPWLRITLLIGLIALADMLMWHVAAGISLAVFGIALVVAAVLAIEPQMKRRRLAICSMMALLSVLPIVEMVQPLSVMILSVGIALTLCVIAGLRVNRLLVGAMRLFWVGPVQTIADGWNSTVKGGSVQVHKGQLRRAFLGWGLPVVLTAVFALLFAQANPVLDQWLGDLIPTTLPTPNPERWIFGFSLRY